MTPSPPHGTHATIPSLDGFRALSVAIVVAGHAGISHKIPGGFGVTVFFFLSGFLITTLFTVEARKYGSISLRAFYIRRLLRLSPPLFMTLILVYGFVALGLLPGNLDKMAITSQALYFYNYYSLFPNTTEGATGLNVLWSLSVEEHFYLLYPFLFLAFLANKLKVWHFGVLLGLFCAWRLFNWYLIGVPGEHIYMRSDTRFDSLLWGCLLAILSNNGSAEKLMPSKAMVPLLAVSLAIISFCFLYRNNAFRETWRYSLQGFALMPIFFYAITRSDLLAFRWLNWRPLAKIGTWSYSIYLIHYVILSSIKFYGIQLPPLAAFFVAAIGGIIYAAILDKYIESPVRILRNRIVGHNRSTPESIITESKSFRSYP